MGAVIHYPKFYHYAGKADSDKDWIMARMAVIPPEKQEEVAREYERRFLHKDKHFGRRIANEYLQGVAVEYRDELRRKGLIK